MTPTPIFITIKQGKKFYSARNAKTGQAIFVSDLGCALRFTSVSKASDMRDELTAAGYRGLTLSQERGDVSFRRETA